MKNYLWCASCSSYLLTGSLGSGRSIVLLRIDDRDSHELCEVLICRDGWMGNLGWEARLAEFEVSAYVLRHSDDGLGSMFGRSFCLVQRVLYVYHEMDLWDQSVRRMREPKGYFSNCGIGTLCILLDGKSGLRHKCPWGWWAFGSWGWVV